MKKIIFTSIMIALIVCLGLAYFNRVQIRNWAEQAFREPVPEAKTSRDFDYRRQSGGGMVLPEALTLSGDTEAGQDGEELPGEFNLDVPFTSQSPHKEWDEVHEEACEEASVVMVDYFYQNKNFSGPDEADQEILAFIDFEMEMLGFFESTSAGELAEVIDAYRDYDVDLIYDPSIENIKQAVYSGYPVIVPAAGRILDNPHFQDPGPLYHMLVIKGWTKGSFIANDPGTQHGEDWLYDYGHLMNSIHDWNGGDVENGQKVIIIIKPAE